MLRHSTTSRGAPFRCNIDECGVDEAGELHLGRVFSMAQALQAAAKLHQYIFKVAGAGLARVYAASMAVRRQPSAGLRAVRIACTQAGVMFPTSWYVPSAPHEPDSPR